MLDDLYRQLVDLRVIRKRSETFNREVPEVSGFIKINGEPYWIHEGKAYYIYILEELSERFLQKPEILEECAKIAMALVDMRKVDKIVAIEAMGLPICTALSLLSRKPFVFIGKRRYRDDVTGLDRDGQIEIVKETGYAKTYMYANDIYPGDRVFIFEPIISTGGTLSSVIKALMSNMVRIIDVLAVIEKVDYGGVERVFRETGVEVKTLLKVSILNVHESKGFSCRADTRVEKTKYLLMAERILSNVK